MNDVHHNCQWGQGERWGEGRNETGMSRLALSDEDKQARDWFVGTTQSLGCKVDIDAMGNIYAIRPGKKPGPPTCAGSHLDTQPTGGRYDGILGVCAGIEMLRVLHEHKVETHFPIGVINWTNEEGARFPISMVASGVWSEGIPLQRAHDLQEIGAAGRTMKQELERIGYLGTTEASYRAVPLAAHLELHIEQGPQLESRKQKIGIVEGAQAYRWHSITVQGKDCHAGTTDFSNRSDALLTAAKLILHSHRLATVYGRCLASTGVLELKPGSTNTVPGYVKFSLDIRSEEDKRLLQFEEQLKVDFEKISQGADLGGLNAGIVQGNGCKVDWTLDSPSKAVRFSEECIQCVVDSAGELFGEDAAQLTQKMISGAGHDSVFTSQRCPTSMIFVPCREGISHNPAEYCAPSDCANGAQVLMGAVLRYDGLRAARNW